MRNGISLRDITYDKHGNLKYSKAQCGEKVQDSAAVKGKVDNDHQSSSPPKVKQYKHDNMRAAAATAVSLQV